MWCSDAVPFQVKRLANCHDITFLLLDIVQDGCVPEKCVLLVLYPFVPRLCVGHPGVDIRVGHEAPHPLVCGLVFPLLEEAGQAAVDDGSVDDGLLHGQVLQGVDGVLHAGDGQEGGKVGRVGGCYDEGEEPPEGAQDTARDGQRRGITTYG